MNDGSLVRLHGEALDLSLVAFDSADSDAFAAGEVSLAGYRLIDWAAGRGHPQGAAPSTVEQGLLAPFHRARPILFSGTALGSASFLLDVLSASLSSSAGSRFVLGAEVLTGLATELDDGTGGSSGVGLPPAIAPLGAAVSLASYDTKAPAAVGVAGQSVFLAFPFEGLTGRAERAEVMRRVLAFLELGPPSDGGFPDSRPKSDGGAEQEPDSGAPASGALHVVGSTQRGCSSSGAPVLLLGGWLPLAFLRRRHRPAAAAFACSFVR